MLSIRAAHTGVSLSVQKRPPVTDLQARPSEVYEIVVLDRAHEDAVVPPTRVIRNVTPYRPRSGRRLASLAAAAATLCAATGFAAGVFFGRVPPPTAPEAPAGWSNVHSWLAKQTPVRVEPLTIASIVPGPHLAGWVAGRDLGGGVKVGLISGRGPMQTLAIQLPAEPRMATLRGVSSRAFDIEIGAVAGTVRPQDLAASDDTTFIRRVSVRKPDGSTEGLVRVRVSLDAPGDGNVRVVGRTVYADFAVRPPTS